MILKNLPYMAGEGLSEAQTFNGDMLVKVGQRSHLKQKAFADLGTMHEHFQDVGSKKHLGLISLVSQMANETVPFYAKFLEKNQTLELNGPRGEFYYDIPEFNYTGSYVAQELAGITDLDAVIGADGAPFKLILNKEYRPNDILTYDLYRGARVIVLEDSLVEELAPNKFAHIVQLVTGSNYESFPTEYLRKDVEWFKETNSLGEFSTQYSGFEGLSRTGTITLKFILGNDRGVEASTTMYANETKFTDAGIGLAGQSIADIVKAEEKALGGDIIYIAEAGKKSTRMNSDGTRNMVEAKGTKWRVGTVMEALVLHELKKMEKKSLIFSKHGVIQSGNGTKIINEGMWASFRRGKIIKYTRPGGITRGHLKTAAAYMYANRTDIAITDRVMNWDAGKIAYDNVMNIIKDEVLAQLSVLSRSGLLGTDRLLPSSPVTGSMLGALELQQVAFKGVNLLDIGYVTVTHNASLDYQYGADRFARGNFGAANYARTAYSLVMFDYTESMDASDSKVQNKGVSNYDTANLDGNLFYVKPESGAYQWGYEQGRYSPLANAGAIYNTSKVRGYGVWAWNQSAMWMKNKTKAILIELDDAGLKVY